MLSEKYRIGRRIGGGGMAEVLEAVVVGAEGFARPVAVKRMLPTLSDRPAFGEMFVNEARLASLLHHENIVSVLDFDRGSDGAYYLVMELVRGVDLARVLSAGPLPLELSIYVVVETLRGLAYAHELMHEGRHLGIVHRDISPHNIMISWSGAVKIVDFGIAKAVAASDATSSGALKGKVASMSPEQASGANLDGRTDLFATGIVFHELLTGKRLFTGRSGAEVLAQVLHRPIPLPSSLVEDLPPMLDRVVMSMLDRDPENRPNAAGDVMSEILHIAGISAAARSRLKAELFSRFPQEVPPSADLSGPALAAAPSQERGPGVSATAATVAQHPSLGGATTAPAPPAPDTVAMGPRAGGASPRVTPPLEPTPALPATLPEPRRRSTVGVTLAVFGLFVLVGAAATHLIKGEPRAPLAATVVDSQPLPIAAAESAPKTPPPEKALAADASKPPSNAGLPTPPDAGLTQAVPVKKGVLRLLAKPWAVVYVNGRKRGTTPLDLRLSAGQYRVRLENGEKKFRRRVQVEAGKRKTVRRSF